MNEFFLRWLRQMMTIFLFAPLLGGPVFPVPVGRTYGPDAAITFCWWMLAFAIVVMMFCLKWAFAFRGERRAPWLTAAFLIASLNGVFTYGAALLTLYEVFLKAYSIITLPDIVFGFQILVLILFVLHAKDWIIPRPPRNPVAGKLSVLQEKAGRGN